ncbi:MAG: hypothetical protein ACOH2M_16300, partial [Cypionkella sp.]
MSDALIAGVSSKRLAAFRAREAKRIQHRATGRAVGAVHDTRGVLARRVFCFWRGFWHDEKLDV